MGGGGVVKALRCSNSIFCAIVEAFLERKGPLGPQFANPLSPYRVQKTPRTRNLPRILSRRLFLRVPVSGTEIGGVPTTPDPSTSAKASRYKWEPYRDTNSWCIYYFLPSRGHTFAKYGDRNGRCIAILFKVSGSGVDSTLLMKVVKDLSENCRFSYFDKFLTNFRPPD